MRAVLPFGVSLALAACLAAAGCRAGSPRGAITSGDVVIDATIVRLEGDQFETDFTIDRLLADGTRESLAAPSVISRAGERAEISIEEDDRRIVAMVHVPGPDDRHETVRVQVTIEEPGRLRSPRMQLAVPPERRPSQPSNQPANQPAE